MSKNDRRAAAVPDKPNIAWNPVRGSFIGLRSY